MQSETGRQKAVAAVHDTRTAGCFGRFKAQPRSPGLNWM